MGANIYQVIDTKTKKIIATGFASRGEARKIRDTNNDETDGVADGDDKPRFVISRGSDHPLGETDGFDYKSRKKRNRR